MSSLSSFKRKLNAKRTWIATEVQRKKTELAQKFVEEKVKTDPEFARDVLTAVGDNLPPDIKKAAEETVARELNKVVNLPKHTTEELLKKWEACETVENLDPKTAVILESQPQPVSEEQLKLIKKWEKTGLLDGITDTSKCNTALLIESQAKQLLVDDADRGYTLGKTQPLPEGAKPYIADGGCSPVDVPVEELLKTLEKVTEEQEKILNEGISS